MRTILNLILLQERIKYMNSDNNVINEKLLKLLKAKIIFEEAKNVNSREKGDSAMAKRIREIIEETVKNVN